MRPHCLFHLAASIDLWSRWFAANIKIYSSCFFATRHIMAQHMLSKKAAAFSLVSKTVCAINSLRNQQSAHEASPHLTAAALCPRGFPGHIRGKVGVLLVWLVISVPTAHISRASDPVEAAVSDGLQNLPPPVLPPTLPTKPLEVPQQFGLTPTFLSLAHPELPPLPFNPFPELPSYPAESSLFVYDDREVDYVQLRAEAGNPPADDTPGEGPWLSSLQGRTLSGGPSRALTIERIGSGLLQITGDLQNNTCYALLSKTNLWQQNWNGEYLFTTPVEGPWTSRAFRTLLPAKFFEVAEEPLPIVSVECYCDAVVDSGQSGRFVVRRQASNYSGPLNVYWTIGGTAAPGVDYVALPNPVTIPATYDHVDVEVVLSSSPQIQPPYETVAVSLTPTDTYYVSARHGTATVKICEHLFIQAVRRQHGPIGIDFYPVQGNESLLISDNFWSIGDPIHYPGPIWNFTRIMKVNGNVEAVQWSTVQGLPDEIKVATVKQSVANF